MPNDNNKAKAFIHDQENTKRYLDALWKELNYGVAYISTDGTTLKVNSYLCELLEYTESELQHRTFKELTHPDDISDDIEMSKKLQDGVIDFYIMSKRYITKTGKVIWAKLKVTGIYDDDGTFIHFISQVTPAITIESPEDSILAQEIREYIAESKVVKAFTLGWFKKEWKWILTTVVLCLGFIIDKMSDYKKYENLVQDTNKIAQENKELIHNLQNQLHDLGVRK